MNISPTEEFLSDDTVIFESRITVADILEMMNEVADDGITITYLTQEVADAIEADISQAVLLAVQDVIDCFN